MNKLVKGTIYNQNMEVKDYYFVVADMFVIELERCFLDFELMNALDRVYPQFWMQFYVDFSCILLSLKNKLKQKGETLAIISYKTFEFQHAIVHV
jgi:hypothetical protein